MRGVSFVQSLIPSIVMAALLMVVAAAPSMIYAQDGAPEDAGIITGEVIEAQTGDPVATASVAVYDTADSTLVTGVATEADGGFEVRGVPFGEYYVEVQFLGYQDVQTPDVSLSPDESRVDLGRIELVEDQHELGELEVVTEREYQERGIDRTIYNVRDQPLSSGGSAIDVLETIPSLEVGLDGDISLRGSQGIEIYINNRPAPMSGEALTGFLRGLNADDVERVETIPNPSARHQPEGSAGIVNIVLAQDAGAGWGGGLSGNASTGDRYGASGNLRYGGGGWTVNGNYGLRYRQRTSSRERFRENRFTDPLTYLEQNSQRERTGLSHYLNTNVEYELGERNTVSLAAIFSQRHRDRDNLATYSHLDFDESITGLYDRQTIGESNNFDMDYRLRFRHVIEPGSHELTAEARYERDVDFDRRRYINDIAVNNGAGQQLPAEQEQMVDQDELENEVSLQVDYERPLGEAVKMEAGYRGSFERLNSELFSQLRTPDSEHFAPDGSRNNAFIYDELLNAGYGIIGADLGDLGAQVGLRVEQAATQFDLYSEGERYQNSYFSFFPSVHLSYAFLEHATLNASYSKRVRRPRTWQMNPFDSQEDPTYRRAGNPALEPEYTHSSEIGVSQLGDIYTVTLSAYHRLTVNSIEWNQRMEDGVTIRTFDNFDTRDSYGLELTGSLRLADQLRLNGSINGFRRVTDGSNVDEDLTHGAYGYTTRLRASWEVRDGLDVQMMQYYRAPMEVATGRRSARSRTSLAVRQQLFGERMDVNLSVRDIFRDPTRESIQETERFFQRSIRERDPRGIRLSLRYNFTQDSGGRGGGRRGR